MNENEALAGYLVHLERLQSGRSTFQQTCHTSSLFARFCRARGVTGLLDVTAVDVDAFRLHLLWTPGTHGRLYAMNSVHTMLGALRRYFRWLWSTERILIDPFYTLVLPRLQRTIKTAPTTKEIDGLFSHTDGQTVRGLRDRAVLELLYGTGLRSRECCRLDVAHVDFEQQVLIVHRGKGQKTRVQPLGSHLCATLEDYLARARPQLIHHTSEAALFVGIRGRRISYRALSHILWFWAKTKTIDGFTPHSMRRAFAAHLLAGGARLEDVQRLMGHAWAETTSRYVQVTPDQIMREHERTHPRARRHR